MSDKLIVRALQPIYDHRADRIYSQDEEFETDRDFVQGLIDLKQAIEVTAPSLIAVPEVGLYLPTDSFVEPEPVESPSEKPKKGFG